MTIILSDAILRYTSWIVPATEMSWYNHSTSHTMRCGWGSPVQLLICTNNYFWRYIAHCSCLFLIKIRSEHKDTKSAVDILLLVCKFYILFVKFSIPNIKNPQNWYSFRELRIAGRPFASPLCLQSSRGLLSGSLADFSGSYLWSDA